MVARRPQFDWPSGGRQDAIATGCFGLRPDEHCVALTMDTYGRLCAGACVVSALGRFPPGCLQFSRKDCADGRQTNVSFRAPAPTLNLKEETAERAAHCGGQIGRAHKPAARPPRLTATTTRPSATIAIARISINTEIKSLKRLLPRFEVRSSPESTTAVVVVVFFFAIRVSFEWSARKWPVCPT